MFGGEFSSDVHIASIHTVPICPGPSGNVGVIMFKRQSSFSE